MFMNRNSLVFNDLIIDIPKIDEQQYLLLRHVFIVIDKNKTKNKSYYLPTEVFSHMDNENLIELLKTNIKLSIYDKKSQEWYISDIINDIKVEDDKIFFRPATILRDIILEANTSPKNTYVKYLLFNGIRYKPSLLFIDYILTLGGNKLVIDVQDLKEILEMPDMYWNFNALNATVISRIIEDINTKTSYKISYSVEKENIGSRKKKITLTFDYYNRELGK